MKCIMCVYVFFFIILFEKNISNKKVIASELKSIAQYESTALWGIRNKVREQKKKKIQAFLIETTANACHKK